MGALTGLKILDFSTLLPGPYATLVMADMGAEVVSIAAPGRKDILTEWPPEIGNTGVTAVSAWIRRNKKTIELDLKTEAGVEAVKRLIKDEGYDILLEQFRPGVMDKLGLGYEQLRDLNPRLIYCSLTGYGQTGPMAMRAGHDINYLSRSGNMSHAGRRETGPVLTNVQIADVAAGSMNSIISILAAVHYRHETGRGQYIDVAMMDGVVPFNGMDSAAFLGGGVMPGREQHLLNGGTVYDFYETADGRYMSVGSLEPKFFAALCKGLQLEGEPGASLKLDSPETKEKVRAAFKSRTMEEWCAVFADLDACVEPVLTLEEARQDAQVRERGMMPDVPLPAEIAGGTAADDASKVPAGVAGEPPAAATVQQPGCPLKLSECPPEYRHAGYPTGYHTREILEKLGLTEEQIREAAGLSGQGK